MSFWWFYISQNEIEAAALDLIERQGEGAREEAIRLADVGRRLGSERNSAIFRRAARYIASGHLTTATRVPMSTARSGNVAGPLTEFPSPCVTVETEACE